MRVQLQVREYEKSRSSSIHYKKILMHAYLLLASYMRSYVVTRKGAGRSKVQEETHVHTHTSTHTNNTYKQQTTHTNNKHTHTHTYTHNHTRHRKCARVGCVLPHLKEGSRREEWGCLRGWVVRAVVWGRFWET
jgi:hypothetical protein